jgi:hypothetical protein
MQVVKQRMQTGQFASAHGAVRQIVGAEGVRGLYAVWMPCITWGTYILGCLQLYVDLYVFDINIHKINEAGYYGLDGTVSRDLDHFCYETCPLMQFSSASMSSSGLSFENWYSNNLSGTYVFCKESSIYIHLWGVCPITGTAGQYLVGSSKSPVERGKHLCMFCVLNLWNQGKAKKDLVVFHCTVLTNASMFD